MTPTIGTRIRITHPNLNPGRTGTIKKIATVAWEPLYTIQLDHGGFPGGGRIRETHKNPHDEGRICSSEGSRVELRRDEFQAI